MQRNTQPGDYHRLGETFRPGLRLATGPRLRVRRRRRAAPPAPLADHAGQAPTVVTIGGGHPLVPITHGAELPCKIDPQLARRLLATEAGEILSTEGGDALTTEEP